MKKIIAAIVAHIFLIFGIIVGIGIFSETKANEGIIKFTGELERNVTLRILENDTAIKQGYFQELLDAFNAAYAEYGITAVDANMDQYSDLENDGPYGYGPDVLYQANDRLMKYVEGKHIQPLPVETLECFDNIDQKSWDAYRAVIEGEEYYFGVPVNIQGPLMYYRKDLLPENWQTEWDDNKNNIPDMLENWNDMYKFSLIRKQQGKFGYMRSFKEPYFSFGYLFSYGGYIFGNNNTDYSDIGLSKGEAEKGAWVIKQLASMMNEWCIDDTITVNAYAKIGNGDYFATVTTPDVYTLFIDQMVLNGMSRQQAIENLGITSMPALPLSGDLTQENPELIPNIMMGGINGYAISSYTKAPNAALAFVNFATSYEMILRRNQLLGIAPARVDVAKDVGGLSEIINQNLSLGYYEIMPSIKETAQIWTPAETLFSDIAKDAFREKNEVKYTTLASYKAALQKVDKQIYDAIHTLQ
ncbi:MAG TPA: extracellular solute-binding protein [Clostridia bacterium]